MENFFASTKIPPVTPGAIDLSFAHIIPQKTSSEKNVLDIPLKERISDLLNDNYYLSLFKNFSQSSFKKALKNKEEILNSTNVELTENEKINTFQKAANDFMKACFSEKEMLDASRNLLNPDNLFSVTDRGMMKIGIGIRHDDLDGLVECFGPQKGIFQALLRKNATDLTDMLGTALKKDPRTILRFALISIKQDQSKKAKTTLSKLADAWAGKFLDIERLKILLKAENLTPKLSKEERYLKKKEVEKARRYQNDFQMMLLYYLDQAPPELQSVFEKVLPLMTQSEPDFQEAIWDLLFQKLQQQPKIQGKVICYISDFLKNTTSKEAQRVFYHSFVKFVPADKRAEIIGQFNQKTLKQYIQNAEDEKSFIFSKIKANDREKYLKWHLFDKQEISVPDMISLLTSLNLEKYKQFIFTPKESLDKDLFLKMCEIYSESKLHFWKWIKSFEKVENFEKKLATFYPLFHEKIKHNSLYVTAMNNHFDLIRQCALLGDTGSLSILKNLLEKNVFLHHLTKSKPNEISGLSALCQQNKRGVLKLISGLPIEKQQELMAIPDGSGKSPLDYCSGNYLRIIQENIFKGQCVEKVVIDEKKQIKEERPLFQKKVEKTDNSKAKFPRQIIKLSNFENNLKQLTNKKLLQEIEETIQNLSTMSGTRIQAEMREGWKNHGTLEKIPCAVKDIRGNNYRLGFLVHGDTDKNQGKIVFLFLWTHGQYNTLLNKQGPLLVKQAVNIMDSISSPNPALPQGCNSGR